LVNRLFHIGLVFYLMYLSN